MVTAWGIFFPVLILDGGSIGVSGILIVCFLLGLTWWAIELVVREWRGGVGRFGAARVAGFTTLLIVWLTLLVRSASPLMTYVVLLAALGLAVAALVRRRRRNRAHADGSQP
jgi:hypothetical protein